MVQRLSDHSGNGVLQCNKAYVIVQCVLSCCGIELKWLFGMYCLGIELQLLFRVCCLVIELELSFRVCCLGVRSRLLSCYGIELK